MKTIIKYVFLFACCLGCSCNPERASFDTEIAIVFDETDPLAAQYPTSEAITGPLGLHDNPWQGVRVTFTYISDKDVNEAETVTLQPENQWMGNIAIRKAEVSRFIGQLRHQLAAMKPAGICAHSIIFRTIAAQANRLALFGASHKLLLVYSDLVENSDLSFYDRRALEQVTQHPDKIISSLERTAPINNLSGIGVWLLYEPASYGDNNTYMKIAHLYRQVFTSKGAVTHIANTFSL